jgi:hypothetical protein
MVAVSCFTALLSTQFWPTAKQGINNRTINPIDFFGTIIQIPICLFISAKVDKTSRLMRVFGYKKMPGTCPIVTLDNGTYQKQPFFHLLSDDMSFL